MWNQKNATNTYIYQIPVICKQKPKQKPMIESENENPRMSYACPFTINNKQTALDFSIKQLSVWEWRGGGLGAD
jgi:hypothetical protein